MTEVVGTCSGITEKPTGWVDLEITVPDKQYPVRLSTKDEALIIAARALAGDLGRFSYTEKASEKINPNSGKPYMNRYLDHVEPAESNGDHAVPETKYRAVIGGDKDRSITRMACLKAASAVTARFPIGTEDPALECMKIADRFERWVYRDIDDIPFGE